MRFNNCSWKVLMVFLFLVASFANAEVSDLKEFKNTIQITNEKFTNQKTKKKPRNEFEKNIDSAFLKLSDISNFAEDNINNDNAIAALASIDFLTLMIDSLKDSFPRVYNTSLEKVDFSLFSDQELLKLQNILEGMENAKFDRFKENMHIMNSLQNEDFPIQNYMSSMGALNVTIKKPKVISAGLDLSDFSQSNIDSISKEINAMENQLAQLDVSSISENLTAIDTSAIAATLASIDTSIISESIGSAADIVNDYVAPQLNNSFGYTWIQSCTGGVCVEYTNPTDAQVQELFGD